MYEERKKQSAVKSKSKKSTLKEIKLRPTTGDAEIKRYAERIKEFIEKGNRVRIDVTMRGRENMYPEIAQEKLDALLEKVGDIAKAEAEPKRFGRAIRVVLVGK